MIISLYDETVNSGKMADKQIAEKCLELWDIMFERQLFEEGELEENSVVRKFRTTASDGKNYNTTHYNLDIFLLDIE